MHHRAMQYAAVSDRRLDRARLRSVSPQVLRRAADPFSSRI